MSFYQTGMGRKFFGSDVPHLIRAINRLAKAIESQGTAEELKEGSSINKEGGYGATNNTESSNPSNSSAELLDGPIKTLI